MDEKTESEDKSTEINGPDIGVPQAAQDGPGSPQVSAPAPPPESAATAPQESPDFGGLKPDTVKPTREHTPLDELGDLGKLIKALRSARVINANGTTIKNFGISRLIPYYTIDAPGTADHGAFDLPKFKSDFEGYIDSIKLDIGPIRL